MKNNSLGDRMKEYENISRIYLTKRMPVILRIDGAHFHTFTKHFKRPFDNLFMKAMQSTTQYLCQNIMGCKLAYTQSDEISLLLIDYDNINTEPWFGNNLQKLVSIAASMAAFHFNRAFKEFLDDEVFFEDLEKEEYNTYIDALKQGAYFDARAFVLPQNEVCNYFIWRQQDAVRNSIQASAQAVYSHKELENKNQSDLQEMLHQKGINWNDFAPVYKRGVCCIKEYRKWNNGEKIDFIMSSDWVIDYDIPIFTQNRNYIERFVYLVEE